MVSPAHKFMITKDIKFAIEKATRQKKDANHVGLILCKKE